MELTDFFTSNLSPGQKQYEALRAVAFNESALQEIAQRFGYTTQSLRTLVNRLLKGEHQLFPTVKPGPKKRQVSPEIINLIISLRRREKLSSTEICGELNGMDISLSTRTVERILSDAGFPRLHRRTFTERGITKKGAGIPQHSTNLAIAQLKPFRAECQVAGVFFFIPYIVESGILELVKKCSLPESSEIGSVQAALSFLALKLIGNERLSHIDNYNHDPGFGLFAGLNVLPKPTYICTYSCRTEAEMLLNFQKQLIENFLQRYPDNYASKTINLDFHSIPHFGEESQMEKVWTGTRNKAMKGANTFFAQDSQSDAIIYTRTDIKRSESSEEINKFVDYWLSLKGAVDETLVLDSKLTRYDILYDLDRKGIKFITLRRRSASLTEQTSGIPESDWERIKLNIPKRKWKKPLVHYSEVSLQKGENPLRQLIIKDHGRAEPTFLVSNNWDLKLTEFMEIYARRWRIENKLAELVKFFNLNTLSSPVMARIHFDLLWTVIADTLYHLFANDLRYYEKSRVQSIFRRFVDMPGLLVFDGKSVDLRIRKRAFTPILKGLKKLKGNIKIPWLDDLPLSITWTA